jgi:acyl carrier protein
MPDRTAILDRLTTVFREVFEDDALVIHDATTADDIDEWDSLQHIVLVLAVEREFKVRLNPAEVGKLENVGAMADLLAARAA